MSPELIQALKAADVEAETRSGRKRLSFSPALEEAFRLDINPKRRFRFRRTALFGLLVYNLFLVADVVFLEDTLHLALGLHVIMTGWLALVAVAMNRALSPQTTELLAASLPLVLVAQIEIVFLSTTSHMADQYQYFVVLVAMFGNAILRLRFWVAAVMSSLVMVIHGVSAHVATSIEAGAAAMSLISLSGSIYITLISNAVQEAEFRRDWLRRRITELRAYELSRDNAKLSRLSRIDPLTGVRNRRGFDLAVEQFCAANDAYDPPFCVVMLDVDYFKSYNDTFGHAEGDRCLQSLANVMSSCLRAERDVLARFGGEEFVAFIPNCHLAEASKLAERIRRALVAAAIPHSRPDGGCVVTASLGVAEGRLSGIGALHDAIAHADVALYDAKKGGRNRVEPPPIRKRITSEACMESPPARAAS